jgi:RNA polymerase sigma factor (sigma-70 family)
MSATEDRELITAFQQGNESAFNELVQRYQEKIYWVARRFVQDHDQADEIVQEVFVKTYKSLHAFRSESTFYTWIYRIVVNASLNAVRKQRIREFLRIDEFFDVAGAESDQPDEQYERREQQALIENAIDQLPEKQKAVFLLRYYEELPYEEISKILKTSVGGLKANYFHALKKIGEIVRHAHTTR